MLHMYIYSGSYSMTTQKPTAKRPVLLILPGG